MVRDHISILLDLNLLKRNRKSIMNNIKVNNIESCKFKILELAKDIKNSEIIIVTIPLKKIKNLLNL